MRQREGRRELAWGVGRATRKSLLCESIPEKLENEKGVRQFLSLSLHDLLIGVDKWERKGLSVDSISIFFPMLQCERLSSK